VVDRFIQEIVESGEIESSSNVEVRCEVGTGQGGVAILEVVPEGTYVKEGDFLARLDDSGLKERRVTRQIDAEYVEAALAQSKADLENAKLELKEYESGLYREAEEKLESEEFVARENLRRAEEYLQYSENLAAKGYVSSVQLEADRFALEKASKELEVARTRLEVLRKYTRETLSSFTASIETAFVRLSSAQKAYEIDKAQLEEVEFQLAHCVITAPSAGQVVYANDNATSDEAAHRGRQDGPGEADSLPFARSEAHANAGGDQRIPDRQSQPGHAGTRSGEGPSRRRIDGRTGQAHRIPAALGERLRLHIKNYGATILIDNPPDGLRPGMTAEATIVLTEEPEAMQIPIQSVIERNKRFFCVVAGAAGGSLSVREVQIGEANQQSIVIEAGLIEGEQVALSPSTYIDAMTLPDPSELIAGREPQRQAPTPRDNPS